MSNIPYSFRANQKTIDRFKAFAKETGCPTSQFVDQLINLWESQQIREITPTRQKEIDAFDAAMKRIHEIYQNSLTAWAEAKDQAESNVSKQIERMEKTISDLQSQCTVLIAENKELRQKLSEKETALRKMEKDTSFLEKALNTHLINQSNILTLANDIKALQKSVQSANATPPKPSNQDNSHDIVFELELEQPEKEPTEPSQQSKPSAPVPQPYQAPAAIGPPPKFTARMNKDSPKSLYQRFLPEASPFLPD